ncbi:MazG nucleotide pyrophosphohydrolase domain-containing protein [Corynebacterium pacaense]|uniref:MazG nucleotide pyrophosphohydrolase domain-containing protein n=1 Tax=Corynebacterium pacaense TaxID=1816684 RepID=UPI0009BABFF3|nr:MazG nucleotide pyrophosphohydrolase domain-containing protein [Corynebacterium pacaense]
MTIVLIDSTDPVLPAAFLDAVLGRGEPVEVDDSVSLDIASWGLQSEVGAPWFLTTRADLVDFSAPLIDARVGHVARAVEVMRKAVGMGEWESAQTHESLIPYLREESEEFIEAVGIGDETEMCRELGDVLLQVLFHAELAARRGSFDFSAVAASFVAKMESRSPYLFDGTRGTVGVEEQQRYWAEGKAAEKSAGR